MNKIIKRLIIAVVITALVCGGAYGGFRFYRNSRKKPVKVVSVSEVVMPAEYYMEEQQQAYGTVALDRMQTVYLSNTQTVTEMLVKEGQEVKKGDPLFNYDTTLTDIQIEKAENELLQIELSLKRAREDLEKIGRLSPSSESEEGEPTENEEEPDGPMPEELLMPERTPLRMSGSGTMEDPYIYLWGARDALSNEDMLLMFRPDDWLPEDVKALSEKSKKSKTSKTSLILQRAGLLPVTVFGAEAEAPDEVVEEGQVVDETDTLQGEPSDQNIEEGHEVTNVTENNVVIPENTDEEEGSELPVEEGSELPAEEGSELPAEEASEEPASSEDPASSENSASSEASADAEDPETSEVPYVDLTGCPNEVWVLLEIHESDSPEGALVQTYAMHLIRDEQDVAVRPYNPDMVGKDAGESDADDEDGADGADGADVTDGADDEGLDDVDDVEEDDEEEGGVISEADSDEDDESPSSLDTSDSDVDENGTYTADEIADMRKTKEKEVRDLTLDYKMAELNLKEMKAEAGDGSVRAKIKGVVKVVRDPETAFQNNEPVVTVSGGGGYNISIGVSELDILTLKPDQEVEVTSYDGDGQSVTGTIKEIGEYPQRNNDSWFGGGNPNVSFYPVKVYVDGDSELREGDYVSVKYGDISAGDSMVMEKMFVRTDGSTSYVFKMGEDGRLVKQRIQVGKSPDAYMVEIRGGITGEDYIAFPYGTDVTEGAATEIVGIDELYG